MGQTLERRDQFTTRCNWVVRMLSTGSAASMPRGRSEMIGGKGRGGCRGYRDKCGLYCGGNFGASGCGAGRVFFCNEVPV